jgi:hypothetical protein
MWSYFLKILNDPQSITMLFLAFLAYLYSRARKNKESGIEIRKDVIRDIFHVINVYKQKSSYYSVQIFEEKKYNNNTKVIELERLSKVAADEFLYSMIGHLTILNIIGSRKFKKWFFEKQKSSFTDQPWFTTSNIDELTYLMSRELKMVGWIEITIKFVRKTLLIK